jgi:UDP-N-acetylglucosamine 2-epimerase (non-hydrolysing)
MNRGASLDVRLPVLMVVGTRPEAIKLVPIILALRESRSFVPVVIGTGQHHAMVGDIMKLAGIEVDVHLWVGAARSRLNERTAETMRRFDDYCRSTFGEHPGRPHTAEELARGEWPVATLVHGDTTSAMASALASFHLHIPVIHVEAGLRTGGYNFSPFPEELNRQLITCIAAFHLAPTAKNQENLVRESVPAEQIFVTGNTGIDALRWAALLDVPISDPAIHEMLEREESFVVVTAHRRENWGGGLARIADGVARVARSHEDVRFVVSVHPNPAIRAELAPPLEALPNVLLTEPLPYAEFARLLGRCKFAITDSGGIQEEAPSLGKPVLVTRDSTERTEGVEAGTLRLVGTDPERIAAFAGELLDNPASYARMASAENPYGDGRAAERIVGALEHLQRGGYAPEAFGSGYTRLAVLSAAGYQFHLEDRGLVRNIQESEPEEPEHKEMWPPRT